MISSVLIRCIRITQQMCILRKHTSQKNSKRTSGFELFPLNIHDYYLPSFTRSLTDGGFRSNFTSTQCLNPGNVTWSYTSDEIQVYSTRVSSLHKSIINYRSRKTTKFTFVSLNWNVGVFYCFHISITKGIHQLHVFGVYSEC